MGCSCLNGHTAELLLPPLARLASSVHTLAGILRDSAAQAEVAGAAVALAHVRLAGFDKVIEGDKVFTVTESWT